MIAIEYLCDQLDFAPTLARWHFEAFGGLIEGDSSERRRSELIESAGRRAIPSVFVATEAGRLVGSATLAPSDMDTRPELTPWLADVFVAPEFRRRGIASALVRRVVREAGDLGVPEVYLFTIGSMRERLYAGLGWKVIERPVYMGAVPVLMSITR